MPVLKKGEQRRILLLWGLGKDKDATKLLTLKETFNELSEGDYLPKAYRLYLGRPEDFFKKIGNILIPEIPEVYDEMSDLKYEIGDFSEALRLIDTALNNSSKLKKDWYVQFLKRQKALCLYELKKYPECQKISKELIDEGYEREGYRLNEACKKALKK